MPKCKKIPMDVSIHVRYLHQDKGEGLKDLILKYPENSKTSLHRHSKLTIGVKKKMGDIKTKVANNFLVIETIVK